jgi:15-cis-phytoene synthase
MTIDACAALVQRGDPDRFMAVMAAPVAARARLFVIYAWNLEVARAPWVTSEPLIAEMRLQFWRDVLEGPRRSHEVAGPLFDIRDSLPVDVMDRLVAARMWDVGRDAHDDLDGYLEATGAGLMWAAARALGAADAAEPVARGVGWATGLANYLRAVPELEARGRVPLVDGRAEGVRALAQRGLARLAEARLARKVLGAGAPALLAGWQTQGLLAQVVRDPMVVADGRMGLAEASKRGRLLWQAVTGRW